MVEQEQDKRRNWQEYERKQLDGLEKSLEKRRNINEDCKGIEELANDYRIRNDKQNKNKAGVKSMTIRLFTGKSRSASIRNGKWRK